MTSEAHPRDSTGEASPATADRPGGEVAAEQAAGLLLALAGIITDQVAASTELHPDLYSGLVQRLRRTAVDLATAHGLHALLDEPPPPIEGVAWAQQLAALLRESPRERHDATQRPGDLTVAGAAAPDPTAPEPTSNTGSAPDQVTERLDRSGQESFPASDPPSV